MSRKLWSFSWRTGNCSSQVGFQHSEPLVKSVSNSCFSGKSSPLYRAISSSALNSASLSADIAWTPFPSTTYTRVSITAHVKTLRSLSTTSCQLIWSSLQQSVGRAEVATTFVLSWIFIASSVLDNVNRWGLLQNFFFSHKVVDIARSCWTPEQLDLYHKELCFWAGWIESWDYLSQEVGFTFTHSNVSWNAMSKWFGWLENWIFGSVDDL